MVYKIINKTNSASISRKAKVADNFFSRLSGFMFRKRIDEDEALIFYKAPSIHTFFMRFPIDIVFLDRQNRAVRICKAVKPWRAAFCLNSSVTIELPSNKTSTNSLKLGDILEILPI